MNVHSIKRGRPLVDDKRRRILDAALTTFAERGYHGTAVPEVAQAAKVSTGTLYHYFASKELLVNEVYRDAKTRLRAALLAELPALDPYGLDRGRAWFTALWDRLGAFARAEPDAFRFLEMQDHAPYLDGESRALELSVLAPLWVQGQRLTARGSDAPPVDVAIALLWGAFVGLVKASRLGYLKLDDASLAKAGAACWRMIAPQLPRTGEAPPPMAVAPQLPRTDERLLRAHARDQRANDAARANEAAPRMTSAPPRTTFAPQAPKGKRARDHTAEPRANETAPRDHAPVRANRAASAPTNPRSPRRTSKG